MESDRNKGQGAPTERLFRLMADNLPGVAWSTDRELRFTASFGAGLSRLGLRPGQVVGKTLYEYFRTEDETFTAIAVHRASLEGRSSSYEQHWEGRVFDVRVEPLIDRGAIVGCVGVAHDITERKQAQKALQDAHDALEQRIVERTAELASTPQQLEAIYRGMPDGLLVADLETKSFVRANPAICRMLGYTEQELLRLGVCDIHPAKEIPRALETFSAQAEGTLGPVTEIPVLRKDGSMFFADISASRVAYNGRPCLIGFFRDATRRRETEQALRQEHQTCIQLLQAQDHERQAIAYDIHDGLAQYLAGALMELQAMEWPAQHTAETRARYQTTVRLLQQAHAESRRLIRGVRPPVLDEAGVIPAILAFVRECEEAGPPRVEFEYAVQFERVAPTVENSIYRIVQESVTNARRYSGSNRVRIALVQRGDRVQITVQDWGVGFDPEQARGKGFGLEGIRERARLLGGHASIESAAGKGTIVSAELPLG